MCLIIYLDLPLLLGPVVVLLTGTAVSTGSLDAEGASKASGDAESESKASRDTEDTAGVGFAANLALRLVVAPEDAGCVSPTSMDDVGESPASKDLMIHLQHLRMQRMDPQHLRMLILMFAAN